MANEIVLYKPNEQFQLEVQVMDETVWLTQQQMAQLFGVAENNITYHIRGIYKTQELEPTATAQKIRVVRQEGNRTVARSIDFYNLDMIISVGYRVNRPIVNYKNGKSARLSAFSLFFLHICKICCTFVPAQLMIR